MKPGQRRLLIPGLLVALLIVVAVAAAMRQAEAQATPVPVVAHTQVSTINDPRITESSGLAASQAHPGLVYTINDSGDEARIFAVDIASGRVTGVTSISGATWHDAEAIALYGGKIWVADIGATRGWGDERALYVFDEPGPGNHRVAADRYPIDFAGGEVEAEAIAVRPGQVYILSKGWPYGAVFQLTGILKKDQENIAQLTNRRAPAWTTDATTTADGKFVILRGTVQVDVREARTWKLVHVDVIPMLQQGESITLEADGRSYLIGSEGKNSPLVRVAFDPATFTTPPPVIDPATQVQAQHPVKAILWAHQGQLLRLAPVVLVVGLIAAFVTWRVVRKRRRARRAT